MSDALDFYMREQDRMGRRIIDLEAQLAAQAAELTHAEARLRLANEHVTQLAEGNMKRDAAIARLKADAAFVQWMQDHQGSADWGGYVSRRDGYDEKAVRLEWWENGDLVQQSTFYPTLRGAWNAVEMPDAARAQARSEGGE